MCKIHKRTFQKVYIKTTIKLFVFVYKIHFFRLGTNNFSIIDVFYKTKSLLLIENLTKNKEIFQS